MEFLVCTIEIDADGDERFRWFVLQSEDARQAAALVISHVYGEQVPPGTTVNVMPMFKGRLKAKRLQASGAETDDSFEIRA
jgi:hypothetical protein